MLRSSTMLFNGASDECTIYRPAVSLHQGKCLKQNTLYAMKVTAGTDDSDGLSWVTSGNRVAFATRSCEQKLMGDAQSRCCSRRGPEPSRESPKSMPHRYLPPAAQAAAIVEAGVARSRTRTASYSPCLL